MKKVATLISALLDVAAFIMFLVVAGFAAFIAVTLFGMGGEVAGTETNVGSGKTENALVNAVKGLAAGVPIVIGVAIVALAIALIVCAIVNLQSSKAGFSFVKNGTFANFKQQGRMRSAMGIEFFIGVFLIAVFVVFRQNEGFASVGTVCIIGGILALCGAIFKIPAIRTRIQPPGNPMNGNNPNNRW